MGRPCHEIASGQAVIRPKCEFRATRASTGTNPSNQTKAALDVCIGLKSGGHLSDMAAIQSRERLGDHALLEHLDYFVLSGDIDSNSVSIRFRLLSRVLCSGIARAARNAFSSALRAS